jgi:hypothetical protein
MTHSAIFRNTALFVILRGVQPFGFAQDRLRGTQSKQLRDTNAFEPA